MHVGLVGLGLFGGEAAESREDARRDADGDQMLGIARNGAAYAAGATELLVCSFRNVPKVQPSIRQRLELRLEMPEQNFPRPMIFRLFRLVVPLFVANISDCITPLHLRESRTR